MLKQLKSVLLLAALTSVSVGAYEIETEVRIVGGTTVASPSTEAPFIVQINDYCGASLVAAKWVLTAGHCVEELLTKPSSALLRTVDGKFLAIKRAILYPKFSYLPTPMGTVINNDYALLELVNPVDFKATIARPIKLATPQFEAQGGQKTGVMTTVYGYGLTNENAMEGSDILLKVTLPIVSREEATVKEAYPVEAATDAVIFAGFKVGGKDACQGDSGGPLTVTDANNQKVLIGVVSWGEGCARPNKYGVYSKVSKAAEWVNAYINGTLK